MRAVHTGLIMLLCCCLPTNARPQNDVEKNWKGFSFSSSLNQGSPFNMAPRVLDAPAGKYGFAHAIGPDLFYENGAPARYWGTNLCFGANFPATKEAAKELADRIAFFGFNAVRLHHLDHHFSPEGIFQDPDPAVRDFHGKHVTTLDPEQMDRLDYFLYELKSRGIYMDLNLLVRRRFSLADGVVEADKLDGGAKPMSLFDDKLIELQKQFARDLLTHKNPYTGLEYRDDPAITMVEIVNEASLIHSAGKPMPAYYENQLKAMEEQWKASPNNAGKSTEDFLSHVQELYFTRMTSFLKEELKVKALVTGIGGYRTPKDISTLKMTDYLDIHAYWDHPGFKRKLWDKDDFSIHNKSALRDPDLGIIGPLIRKTPPDKPYMVSEWSHCFPNEYAYETPFLIASAAISQGWDGLFQFSFKHYLKRYADDGMISYYFDTVNNPQQLILTALGGLIFHNRASVHSTVENQVQKIDAGQMVVFNGFLKQKRLDHPPFDFLSRQEGVICLYASDGQSVQSSRELFLVLMGRVKNTGSGWKNGRYSWGTRPVLLQKMEVTVKIKTEGALTASYLDINGASLGAVPAEKNASGFELQADSGISPFIRISIS